MRRTLIAAILGVVVGALVLAGLGTFVAASAGARTDNARELAQDARRVAAEAPAILDVRSATLRAHLLRVVKATAGADFVAVSSDRSVSGGVTHTEPGVRIVGGYLPSALTLARLRPRRLLAGAVVSGTSGAVVYAAVALFGVDPRALPAGRPRSAAWSDGGAPAVRTGVVDELAPTGIAPGGLAGVTAAVPAGVVRGAARDQVAVAPAGSTVVMILTRRFHGAGLGGGYLLLVSGGTLVVAAVVAVVLGDRIVAPLRQAVEATRRIAQGDLSVQVARAPTHYPELDSLVSSLDTMAATLSRARDQERQFLLSVSHDLRTPLTSILGYAEAIGDGAAEDPAVAAGVIASEARRLARLVEDLLDLARIDAHQFSLQVRRVDLHALVRSAVDGFRPIARARGLSVALSAADEDPLWVAADSDRAAQILSNLLENAGKFAAHAITVTVERAAGTSAMVAVADDGPGIPDADLPRVFERHFQASSRSAAPDRPPPSSAGSGLGLAIVAELAAAMGGQVRAISPARPASQRAGIDGGAPGTRMELRLPAWRPAPFGPDVGLADDDRPDATSLH